MAETHSSTPSIPPPPQDLTHQYLLDTLMANLPDAIYFKDREGRFIQISQRQSEMFGLASPQAAVGKSDFDFFSDEHANQAFNDEQEVIRTGEPLIGKEEKETWTDGHITWVSTSKLPLRDADGNIVGTFGLSRDITERRLQDERIAAYGRELEDMNNRMATDIAMASELQRAFLPQTYPSFPRGVPAHQSAIRFHHFYQPSGAVGGDLFTIIPVTESCAGVFICDVMGHGVRSGLVTALIRALVGELAPKIADPGEFLTELNRGLSKVLRRTEELVFSTAFYMTVESQTGLVHYANAGHPSPFVLRQLEKQSELVSSAPGHIGAALVLQPDSVYQTCSFSIAPRDSVLLYTDGIFEIPNNRRELYESERLAEAIQRNMGLPFNDMLQNILDEIRSFANGRDFEDDVCLVSVQLVSGPET